MKRLVILLLLLLPTISFSQKEAAIWYFGEYAGLDFNSGVPVVLTNGQLNTFEGCATISDNNGNLLFYTDGVTVWNNNHTVMPNGNGLLGDESSTQSAIIIPRPNNTNQYYIFTVDARTLAPLSPDGIKYSTVDLSLPPFGDIIPTEKNINLVRRAYEKITAIKNADNNTFWVITFVQDEFLAYRITATGINTTPVISPVTSTNESIGYLKISPNGTKIACANYGTNQSLMLYDFDPATGIVSNETPLALHRPEDIPYGVEFSPQSTKLYVQTDQQNAGGRTPPSKIIQYDLLSANISNSRVLIHTSNTNTRGALQLAIDGKIYRACSASIGLNQIGTPFLGVINDPEANGLACNYVHDAIDVTLGGTFPTHKVVEGLPPFMASFFLEPTISANDVCFGTSTQFTLSSSTPPTSILWNFGDPSSGANNTSTLENPTHLFTAPGIFNITATVTIGAIISNLSLNVTIYDAPIVTSPVVLTQCDDDLDGITIFNLEEANSLISTNYLNETFTYYTNLTAATSADNNFLILNSTAFSNATTSTVWARVENTTNCFTTAEINLNVASTDIPDDLMIEFYECDDATDGDSTNGITSFDFSAATNQVLNALLPQTGFSISYYENTADALAEQNEIDPTNYTNIVPNTQQIVVRADDLNNNCFGLGYHVTLNVETLPIFDLAPTIIFCENETKTISVENPVDNYNYLWEDALGNIVGSSQSITVNTNGLYTVTVTSLTGINCTTTKSIQVTINPIPLVLTPVTLIQCDDDLDGFTDFNLEEANSLISTNYINENITYHTDSIAATTANSTFLIANPTAFSNAISATVWARVVNSTNCYSVSQVNLQVTNTNIPSDLMLLFFECDDIADGDDNNGISTFNFSAATNQILNALLPETNLSVTYYQTMTDGLAEQNPIDPTNYRNNLSPNNQQIIVRVDNLANECFGIGYHVTLTVNQVPQFNLDPTATFCFTNNTGTIGVENPAANYNYIWRNSAGTIVGNTPEIEVTNEDVFNVTATSINVISCGKSKSITVISQPIGVLPNFDESNILISDNATNNTITVLTNNLPVSNYEFALDNGPYQVSNFFDNVSGGLHTVFIQDIDNCLEANVQVSIIFIPNFFTPNFDGFNDTWHVSGIEFQPTSNVYIFDRFGKLIVILDPLGPGWNGLYKGNPLPSTDYWYRVELEDGRILKGHFSLVRQ
jgi:gliding motility-associated-like protein